MRARHAGGRRHFCGPAARRVPLVGRLV